MYAEAKGRGTVLPGGYTHMTSIFQFMTVHVLRCAVIDERQVCGAMYAEAKGHGMPCWSRGFLQQGRQAQPPGYGSHSQTGPGCWSL